MVKTNFLKKLIKINGIGFWIFFGTIFFFNILIFLTPILLMLGFNEVANGLYFGFSFACHQLNSRSYCIFNNSISDCTYNSSYLEYTKTQTVLKDGFLGYKFPVCSRDIGIYFSILIGAIVWGFLNRKNLSNSSLPPKIILFLALLPVGIDGGAQFLGFWESSNIIRLTTGALAGFVCSFYAIPLLNEFFKSFR
ncbi:MAG: DUF2085 domain-containing protein [Candidatus Anstonellaceae archaeon]